MKHTIKGYLVYQTADYYSDDQRLTFQDYKPLDRTKNIIIRPHSIEVDVSDDFDPRTAQVAALQDEITTMRATAEAAINAKVAKLQELLAINNEVSE